MPDDAGTNAAARGRRAVPLGWAASLALHLALLGALATSFVRVPPAAPRPIDLSLVPSGDPAGDPLGWTAAAGPLAPPGEPAELATPTFTAVPLPELRPDAAPGRAPTPAGPGGSGGEGFGPARFGPGAETIRGVAVRTGDPQFTLLWDGPVDLDLHVLEPGGAHIYWIAKGKRTPKGGLLDVDNVKGFGPENVAWEHGRGPPGEYRWYVEYYGGFGGRDHPTRWQVRIKQDGTERVIDGRFRRIGETSRTYTLRVPPRPADGPDAGRDAGRAAASAARDDAPGP